MPSADRAQIVRVIALSPRADESILAPTRAGDRRMNELPAQPWLLRTATDKPTTNLGRVRQPMSLHRRRSRVSPAQRQTKDDRISRPKIRRETNRGIERGAKIGYQEPASNIPAGF